LNNRVVLVLIVGVVLLALLEATLVPHYHPEFPWHYVPGYAAWIGLIGALVAIEFSLAVGRVLQRPRGEDD
jgi:hypothetical protein